MSELAEKTGTAAAARSGSGTGTSRPDLLVKENRNAEQMSNLEQQIALLMKNSSFKVFHFTASREGEGVSSVAAGLAQVMAKKGSNRNFLLIDANFSAPAQHIIFNIPPSPGLKDALLGKPLTECVHGVLPHTVRIMPCGSGEVDLTGAGGQEKLAGLISSLKSQYDCIIIDSSPLLTASDSLAMALVSDITFLVIQANRTLWEVAEKSKLHLEKNGCQIGGVVLNKVVHSIPEWLYKRL